MREPLDYGQTLINRVNQAYEEEREALAEAMRVDADTPLPSIRYVPVKNSLTSEQRRDAQPGAVHYPTARLAFCHRLRDKARPA